MIAYRSVKGDTKQVFDEDGNGRTCPRMAEAGIVFFVLAPCLNAGGRTVANHIIPRVLALTCDEIVNETVFAELAKSAHVEI